MAIALGRNKFDNHYRLALVYVDQQNWWAAEMALKEALMKRGVLSDWNDDHTKAHYFLGKAMLEGNVARSEIDRLENSLKYNDIPEDRFRLAVLNLWLGNDEKVLSEYKRLNAMNIVLARELKKLMDLHKRAG